MSASVAFLLIGGVHQVFHVAPVAAALARTCPGLDITLLASSEPVRRLAETSADGLPCGRLTPAPVGEWVARTVRSQSAEKLPLLWANRRRLDAFDAIVVPECTSLALKRMGVRRPKFICIPHGAGDRAVSFEPRFQRFDRVLVAGAKTARRMVESGVAVERIGVVGYPKADLVRRMATQPLDLFGNGRPTVFYNPHFRASLSSIGAARDVAAAFAAQDRFNLIVAPHIRALADASAAEVAAWRSLGVPGRVHVDTGSDRLIDMSYTSAADIYLGDVSSQVYEFLLAPRPCVFLDVHGVAWDGDPDYAFWNLGEVVAPDQVLAAVTRAEALHRRFLPRQQAAVAETFGDMADGAARAAADIATFLGPAEGLPANDARDIDLSVARRTRLIAARG